METTWLFMSWGEVWREAPKPKFKVGDRVRNTRTTGDSRDNAVFTIEKITWGFSDSETSLISRGHEQYHYHSSLYIPFDEDWLKPAPSEKVWVDVTEECKLTWKEHCIVVEHGGDIQAYVGTRVNACPSTDYKVERTEERLTSGSLKILHFEEPK